MSFLGLPELQPAKSDKNALFKLINVIVRQLQTLIATAPLTVSVGAFLDLTTTATVELVPPRPGYYFVATGVWWNNFKTTGVAAVAPTLSAGNNGTVDNVVPAAAAPAIGVHAAGSPLASALTLAAPLSLVDMKTPILVAVTAAATGGVGFAWAGRVHLTGYYVLP